MRPRVAIYVLVGGLAAARLAAAQTPPVEDAAYDEGRKLYEAGDYAAAIAKFQESYAQHPAARSLFNIAQAYRLSNRCRDALDAYTRFRHEYPDAENIAIVDAFIADLQTCPAPVVAPPPPPVTPALVVARPPPPPPAAGSRRLAVGLYVGGGVGLAAGAIFAVLAARDASQVEAGGGVWDPGIQSSGRTDAVLGKILLGAGAAAIAGGIVVRVTGHREPIVEHVALVPRAGGATVGWSCAF